MIITILSDSVFLPTGYSNQAKQLVKHWRDQGHTIHFLANGYQGADMDYVKLSEGTIFDFKIYGHMQQDYFKDMMSEHLKKTKTDIFFILLDTFMLWGNDGWFLKIDTSPAKTIFWYPSDGGGGMPKFCEHILKKVEKPIAMSRFGQKQVKDYYNIETEHIPHGVDPKRFYKLPDDQRTELRKKWGLNDKFVIGVVARNQPRKNLARTLKTIAKLKDKIPNAILFLHLDPSDPAPQAFNMLSLIQKLNLENRIVFSGMKAFKGFDQNEMNNLYNLMDCFLLTTSGEGFGIPIIEAMACEVPVIATDYTTTQELVIDNKAGLGISLSGTETIDLFKIKSQEYDFLKYDGTITGGWEVERGICSIDNAVKQVLHLYENPFLRKKMGENGRKAVLEKYDFDIVAKKWEVVINGMVL